MAAILLASVLGSTPVLQAFADSSTHMMHHSSPMLRVRESTSTNWSGFAAESSITSPTSRFVNQVVGTWTVPIVNCAVTPVGYSSVWVGIDGYSDSTVEQLGTEQDCSSGSPVYYAWFEMYPHPGYYITQTLVHPGDSITASVTYNGGNIFTLTMKDVRGSTTVFTFSKSFFANAQRSSAEWVVEAPYYQGILPLADYGSVNFSSSEYRNSASGSALQPVNAHGYDPINMQDPSGGSSTTSGLSATGTSFTTTWSP